MLLLPPWGAGAVVSAWIGCTCCRTTPLPMLILQPHTLCMTCCSPHAADLQGSSSHLDLRHAVPATVLSVSCRLSKACRAAGRTASQRTFIRQHSSPSTSMILGLSMHPDGECNDAHGPEMQQLTLMSRQDYARWHSYELHVVTQGVPGISKDKVTLCPDACS